MLRACLVILTALSASAQRFPEPMAVEIVEDAGVSATSVVSFETGFRTVQHYAIRGKEFTAFSVILDFDVRTGEFLVSLEPSKCTPDTILTECHPDAIAEDPAAFTYLPLPKYPEWKPIKPGETLDMPTVANAAGQRIVPHVRLRTMALEEQKAEARTTLDRARERAIEEHRNGAETRRLDLPVAVRLRPQPLSGKARDVPVKTPDMVFIDPKVTLNGKLQYKVSKGRATGPLVWVYLPDHGRYILSLTPRPALGFKRAGEMEYPAYRFAVGDVRIDLDSFDLSARQGGPAVAPPKGVFNLYVLHDPTYEPTSSRDQGKAVIGTVSAREIEVVRDARKK